MTYPRYVWGHERLFLCWWWCRLWSAYDFRTILFSNGSWSLSTCHRLNKEQEMMFWQVLIIQSKHYSSIHEYGPASSQRHAVTRGPEDTQSCQIMLMPSNGRKTNNLYIEQGIWKPNWTGRTMKQIIDETKNRRGCRIKQTQTKYSKLHVGGNSTKRILKEETIKVPRHTEQRK